MPTQPPPSTNRCASAVGRAAVREASLMMYLVSNRLPLTITVRGGQLSLQPSPGGLATGLAAVASESSVAWVGWPGSVPPQLQARARRALAKQKGIHPVFLSDALVRGYYNGFSNRALWPLFHSFPALTRFSPTEWRAYKEANEHFAKVLARTVKSNDTVWVHDFHLMLLPAMLRRAVPRARIGFFLHIPFPPHEHLRLVPWHRELLEGLLGADLIGFHTYDYMQAFLASVQRLLGHGSELGRIVAGGRAVQADVFPLGVDFARFNASADDPAVARAGGEFGARFPNLKLSFSISRLDYTKGIPEQLAGLTRFLEDCPEWRGKFVHLLVVVPSRESVGRYALHKRTIDELVGRINGKYGRFGWEPLKYIYRFLPFEELCALYLAADAAIVTPVRDGMNLVAKEYLAARRDAGGALVLSEMAGAARELLEALIINPYDEEEVARAWRSALEMPAHERRRRCEAMRARIAAYDSHRWARSFLGRLDEAAEYSRTLAVKRLTGPTRGRIVRDFKRARRPLLLLDYDGTLVPLVGRPDDARPDARLMGLLRRLAGSHGARVFLTSGRPRGPLEAWFGDLPVGLVAEHGAWYRYPASIEGTVLAGRDTAWKAPVRAILDLFVGRIPGSFVEEKEFSLVWHYRQSNPAIGAEAAKELLSALTHLTANMDIGVLPGNAVVEVKSLGTGKGAFFARVLANRHHDFILAAGDDETDETLFRALPADAHTVRVGVRASAARFYVEDVDEMRALLDQLSRARHQRMTSR